jgi:hypothetical protein
MICYIRKKSYGVSIEMEKVPDNFLEILKNHLKKYNIKPLLAEKPNHIEWSEKIPLDYKFKKLPSFLKSSGVYRIWYDNQIIYIGSSDCDGNIKGKRGGMWSRRADFKSTLFEEKRYKCASSEVKLLLYNNKEIPRSDIVKFQHQFFSCHPDIVRDIEFNTQKEYKQKYNNLPILNRVKNFTGGARKI